MIRILLKERLADYEFSEKRKVTIGELSEATGISRSTLQRMNNVPGYVTNTEVIGSLCEYFDCQPGDLLVYVKESTVDND